MADNRMSPSNAGVEAQELLQSFENLTGREREVLLEILDGKSVKAAARDLGIAARTLDTHRNKIFLKMKAHSSSELLVRFAKASPELSKYTSHYPASIQLPGWLKRNI